MQISIINGPNLNLVGQREPNIYGLQSLEDYLEDLKNEFTEIDFRFYHSNIEGELVTALQEHAQKADGIIFNPGGYAHTSVAIADAIAAIDVSVIEVHISNLHKRENYRQIMITASKSAGVITGFGMEVYRMGVQYYLQNSKDKMR